MMSSGSAAPQHRAGAAGEGAFEPLARRRPRCLALLLRQATSAHGALCRAMRGEPATRNKGVPKLQHARDVQVNSTVSLGKRIGFRAGMTCCRAQYPLKKDPSGDRTCYQNRNHSTVTGLQKGSLQLTGSQRAASAKGRVLSVWVCPSVIKHNFIV